MSLMKEYTSTEWTQRENYYIEALTDLVLPELPTAKEILTITSRLDNLYTEASFEYANLSRKDSRLKLELKNAEAEFFSIVKQQQLTAGTKVTENDIKGLVVQYLSTNPIHNYKADIYTLIKNVTNRYTFMTQLLKTISEKKASIISATAMLKLEGAFASARNENNI